MARQILDNVVSVIHHDFAFAYFCRSELSFDGDTRQFGLTSLLTFLGKTWTFAFFSGPHLTVLS